MDKYIVETTDGEWKVWTSTPFKTLMNRSLRVKNGTVTLGGGVYNLNPRRMRRMAYRPKRYLGLVKEWARVQLWTEDNPKPVDLLDHNPPTDDITATKFGILARSERLRRLVSPKLDMLTLLLLLSIAGNLLLGITLFYLQRGGLNGT